MFAAASSPPVWQSFSLRTGEFDMSINIFRGASDDVLERIIDVLGSYAVDHPAAEIDLYRQNSVSVRVRIIDPAFAGLGKSARNDHVWEYLDKLPEEVLGDISTLVLLTPDERTKSFANFEYEDPVPSTL
jgi:hypothetical protein